jgi:hypothetical protein
VISVVSICVNKIYIIVFYAVVSLKI